MKKILVVGMTDNLGGIEAVVMSYYRAIDKSRFAFDFLSNNERMAYEDEVSQMGGRVFHITPRHQSFLKFYMDLNSFFSERAKDYDAIWLNVCSLANISYLSFAKRYGIQKRIIHCHNAQNGEGRLRGILHRFNKSRIRRIATDFWSCSNSASEWFFGSDYESIPNYRFIPNVIDVGKYAFNPDIRIRMRSMLNFPDDSIVIGNVARFEYQKNHKALLQIFKDLHELDSRYRLLLIGQGSLENEIRDYVSKNNLDSCVFFTGVRNDVNKLYQAMDVFTLSSLFEGLPISALEAQANGLPCVMSTGCPPSCFVNDNTLRLDFSIDSFDAANKMNTWIKHLSQKRSSALAIRDSIYSIDKQISSFEKAIANEK